ncbi:hypothetical protein [Paenibacillus phytohabitans]|uniref:hypothetical protein n=1 Tax=Paenibacillus phytohabitans TaxID=2654978 RepID=UPI003009D4CD
MRNVSLKIAFYDSYFAAPHAGYDLLKFMQESRQTLRVISKCLPAFYMKTDESERNDDSSYKEKAPNRRLRNVFIKNEMVGVVLHPSAFFFVKLCHGIVGASLRCRHLQKPDRIQLITKQKMVFLHILFSDFADEKRIFRKGFV